MKSHISRYWIAIFCAVIIVGSSWVNVWAKGDNPSSASRAKENKSEKKDPIMQSGILFTAILESAVAGPVAQSYPPIYTHTLTLTVKEVFRGDLTTGQALSASHQARQHKVPVFPVKKLCIVAASDVRGHFNVDTIQEATEEMVNKARMVGNTPHGWKMTEGRLVSPWAAMGKKFWPDNAAGFTSNQLACGKTGRPVLLAGQGVTFSVEPVPPGKEIKWTNPDGDGLYKLTVTNTSSQPRDVAALLTDGKKILWNESIVILCQKKAQPPALCAKRIPKTVKPVTLEPGQSVSGEVNAFGIKGIEWPRGGYRVEILFCLGEKSVKQSFYYMSKHHDKIRKQAEAEQPDGGETRTAIPDASSDYLLSIRFLSETPIELAPNARVKVDVWGHDKLVADVRATLIKTVIAPLDNLDNAIVVPFSREDLATVKPQSGHKNSLGYYFRFKMDTNGDGQTGLGDYGWDFKKTDMMFFNEKQTGQQDVQIHLKKLTTNRTEPLE